MRKKDVIRPFPMSLGTFASIFLALSMVLGPVDSWMMSPSLHSRSSATGTSLHGSGADDVETKETTLSMGASDVFDDFVNFLKSTQSEIIQEIEAMDGSGKKFTKDTWGIFDESNEQDGLSGGITRVLQGGDIVEKGACSLTLIRRGVLSAERAAAIRSRQDLDIKAGDVYYAAALSIVLHSRSPMGTYDWEFRHLDGLATYAMSAFCCHQSSNL
jgi:hypothetical protein